MAQKETAARAILGVLFTSLVVLVFATVMRAPDVRADSPVAGIVFPTGITADAGFAATTTATAIPSCPSTAGPTRSVLIQNNQSTAVRVGPAGIKSTAGIRLGQYQAAEWNVSAESIYAASESGTVLLDIVCGVGGSAR